jgi:alpha-tubulin suppressor-like RCC1 family protein
MNSLVMPVALGLLVAVELKVGCECGRPAEGSVRDDAGFEDAGGAARTFAVGAGSSHACRVLSGQVSCFGTGPKGALGVGDVQPRSLPASVDIRVPFVAIAAGGEAVAASTCGLAETGDVWCWGDNSMGQLGQGDLSAKPPVPHRVLLPVKALKLADAHYATYCVVAEGGSLWCWGSNLEGQLTDGDGGLPDYSGTPVLVTAVRDVVEAANGDGHTCALVDGGDVYCWGRNTDYELGQGSTMPQQNRVPQHVGSGFTRLIAGQSHSCGLKGTRLFCWGAQPEVTGGAVRPREFELDAGPGFIDLSSAIFHACAIDVKRDLYCWGRNAEGQLGLGDTNPRTAPTRITSTDGPWARVAAGRFFTCAQKVDGGVFCTGDNRELQLGLGLTDIGISTFTQQN